ncbi:MAG: NAD(+) synthase, partial [Clostridia bacterium]|nr:NAD(+) synthase [Clostridia bacterium]
MSVADVEYNTKQIIKLINQNKESHVVLFPEFAISGYTIGDLVFDHALQKQVVNGIKQIMSKTKSIDSFIAVGAPLLISGRLYNCAVLMKNGTVYGIVPKTYIAEYSEFSEKRWFSSADELNDNSVYLPELSSNSIPVGTNLVFDLNGKVKIGVEICEDLWVPIPQSTLLTLNGAEIILNLSASTALAGKKSFV